MRLAQAGSTVDEKWVVRFARMLSHRVRRGVGQAIRVADNEGIEGVLGIERRRGAVREIAARFLRSRFIVGARVFSVGIRVLQIVERMQSIRLALVL